MSEYCSICGSAACGCTYAGLKDRVVRDAGTITALKEEMRQLLSDAHLALDSVGCCSVAHDSMKSYDQPQSVIDRIEKIETAIKAARQALASSTT